MRQKSTVTTPSEEEAKECMKVHAQVNSQLKKVESELELKIQKVRETKKAVIDELIKQRDDSFQRLQAYAQGNEDLFTKKKSIDWVHGIFGFRTGTPKVDKNKGLTWAAVLDLLKDNKKKQFIRSKEEVDKDKILSSRNDEKVMTSLGKLGICIKQDETFFVEPKEESINA